MAEVKIQLKGEDNVTPVISFIFKKTRGTLDEMNTLMRSEARALQAGWKGVASLVIGEIAAAATVVQTMDDALDELLETVKSIEWQISKGIEFKIDAGTAMEAVRGIAAEAAKMDVPKNLTLDVSSALKGALRARAAIDAIPDITTKTVIIRYQTQASPVMPFTEGIRYIKEKMESLPRRGDYVLRDRGMGMPSGYQTETIVQAPKQHITYSPTINVNSISGRDGNGLARELDLELARMWRYNRSELRKAVTS